MTYTIEEGTWSVHGGALRLDGELRGSLGPQLHQQAKESLQELLVGYFNSANHSCTVAQRNTIKPIGIRTKTNPKCFKVRWAPPGLGKSGAYRLLVAVYCSEKRVKIAGAWLRKTEPSMDELSEAARQVGL